MDKSDIRDISYQDDLIDEHRCYESLKIKDDADDGQDGVAKVHVRSLSSSVLILPLSN